MAQYEYRVIPAPSRGEKSKSARSAGEKLALALSHLMNELGRDGWEYVRADTLPCEEKKGWTGRRETSFQTLLVFRRTSVSEAFAPAPAAAPAPAPAEKVVRRMWSRPGMPATAAPAAGHTAEPHPAPPPAPAAALAPASVVPAPPQPSPAAAASLTSAAPEGSAPRIFASLPERRTPPTGL